MSDGGIDIGRDVLNSVVLAGSGNHVRIVVYQGVAERIATRSSVAAETSELGENPYRGLSAFREQDAARFFGRDDQIRRLWERLRDLQPNSVNGGTIRVLPVLGPSGSGKSSLVRAGLLPELARHPLPGLDRAQVAVLTPGAHPLESLALRLAQIATKDLSPAAKSREFGSELAIASASGSFDGLRRIADGLPEVDDSPLILVVDQFEELFTLCKPAGERSRKEVEFERAAFVGNLLQAARDSSGHVTVVLTLRTDFIAETQRHESLNALICEDARHLMVPAMSTQELRAAITEPARCIGHEFDEATVALLVRDAKDREGALPLLQFALQRIWEGLRAGVPAGKTYEEIGGVGGALAGEAQRIFDSLDEDDQRIARRIFVGLVQLGEGTVDTRRRARIDELISEGDDPDRVEAILQRFASRDTRLLTLSSQGADGADFAEVTHEALIDRWSLLRSWLTIGRDDVRFQRRLDEAARNWNEKGRPIGSLWRPPDLNLLREFHRRTVSGATPLHLTALQSRFYKSSERALWLQRSGLAAIPVLAIVVLTLLWQQSGTNARHAAELAEEGRKKDVSDAIASANEKVADIERQQREEAEREAARRAQSSEHYSQVGIFLRAHQLQDRRKYGQTKELLSSLSRDERPDPSASLFESLGWWDYYRAVPPPVFSAIVDVPDTGKANVILTEDDIQLLAPSGVGGSIGVRRLLARTSSEIPKDVFGKVSLIELVDDRQFVAAVGSEIVLGEISSSKPVRSFKGAKSYIRSMKVAKGLDLIIAVDGAGSLLTWRLETGELLGSAFDPKRRLISDDLPDLYVGTIAEIAIDPAGRYIATGHDDGRVGLWSAMPLAQVAEAAQHDATVRAMRFSDDRLSTADDLGRINLWKVPGLELAETRQKGAKKPQSYEDPGPRPLWNQSLEPVTVESLAARQFGRGEMRPVIGETLAVFASGDGRYHFTTNRVVPSKMTTAWKYAMEGEGKGSRQENVEKLRRIVAAPDPKALAGQIGDTWLVSLLNDEQGEGARALAQNLLARVEESTRGNGSLEMWPAEERELRKVDWNPDQFDLSTDGSLAFVSQYRSNALWVYDTTTHLRVGACVGHRGRITAIAACPTGKLVASGDELGEVVVWRVGSFEEVARVQYPDRHVAKLCFSADGTRFAVALSKGGVSIRDVETLKETTALSIPGSTATSLAWIPRREAVAVGCDDGRVGIVQASDGGSLALADGHAESVTSIAVSPDGTTAASGGYDGTIRIWDAATGKMRTELRRFHAQVAGLVYSADGRSLFSAGWANGSGAEALLWDVALGTLLADYRMEGRISQFAASADRSTFVSLGGGFSPVTFVWDVGRGAGYRRFERLAAERDRTNHVLPDLAPAELAKWYAFRGLKRAAVSAAARARRDGQLPMGQRWLAQAAMAAGEIEVAEREFAACLSGAKTISERNLAAAWTSHFGLRNRIAEAAKQVNGESATWQLHLQYAKLLHADGQFAAAVAACSKAIELKDLQPEAYAMRALCQESAQEYSEALRDFDTARSLGGKIPSLGRNYAFAFGDRAIAHFKNKDYLSAVNDYDEAIARYSMNWSWYQGRGQSYSQLSRSAAGPTVALRQLSAAIKDYEKIVELDPKPIVKTLKGGGIMAQNTPEGIRGMAFYNIACYESMRSRYQGTDSAEQRRDVTSAIGHLRTAIASDLAKSLKDTKWKGKTLREVFESDSDLDPIRSSPEFAKVLSELE